MSTTIIEVVERYFSLICKGNEEIGLFVFVALDEVEQKSNGSYAWQDTTLSKAACRPLLSAMICIALRNATQSGVHGKVWSERVGRPFC